MVFYIKNDLTITETRYEKHFYDTRGNSCGTTTKINRYRFDNKEKKMKKVVLIGDSIRMGYDKYVKDALENTAEVFYPPENCRFAEYVLRYAHEWKAGGKWGQDVGIGTSCQAFYRQHEDG